jgi:5-hydroxyisourate hydrolase
MGKLTTHVLDVSRGVGAAGVKISVYREGALVGRSVTNRDGRVNAPLASGDAFAAGEYRLEFEIGEYFANQHDPDARRFLDVVPIAFRVEDPNADYHVPLLVSPWSYSTYRGS